MGMNCRMRVRVKGIPFRMLEFTDTNYVTLRGKERACRMIRHLRWVTTPKGTSWAQKLNTGR